MVGKIAQAVRCASCPADLPLCLGVADLKPVPSCLIDLQTVPHASCLSDLPGCLVTCRTCVT